jgi:Ala-tRNA(Pro) deacylase
VVTSKSISLFLDKAGAAFETLQHPPEGRSDEVRQLRQESGFYDAVGAKALLCKSKTQFFVCVLPGERRLDSSQVKSRMGPFRFATSDEFYEQTGGLIPGTLPPFIAPVLPNLGYLLVDPLIKNSRYLAFNAASLTTSIVLSSQDYVKAVSSLTGVIEWLPVSIQKA